MDTQVFHTLLRVAAAATREHKRLSNQIDTGRLALKQGVWRLARG